MYEFEVKGMSCGHCVKAIKSAVLELEPDAVVDVDLAAGKVRVTTEVAAETVRESIVEAGYEVTKMSKVH
ncbi:MAG: heavy-metal-associated domain-containing protein [Silvanigrellales bacterium]|nr:heavy-metal-associated domain-containing protein [Silvanigrellales bacterium]